MNMDEFADKLQIDTALVRKILVEFLRQEIEKVGFSRAVVNLSGGIDSALSCYLAAEALGAQNVLAIRLPYRTSSPDSLEHAQMVIDALGVPSLTVDITPAVEPLFERLPDMNSNRRGNVMARMRMIVLYDQSAAWNGLPVGTSNKTELLLGYGTLFGDMASAVNPLGDLYKTQVRQLAAAVGVPQPIIDKPPSADLWTGQTDEGEMGVTYEQVDRLLYLLVDERYSLDEAVAAGFDGAYVERVWKMVRVNSFKRRLPLIAKVSTRTVGVDFRYLRDWGV
jgi:NAD+ synthase